MKIQIEQQYNAGDEPEDFNGAAYREALEVAYRDILNREYPDSEVNIEFDVQSASGYCRKPQVFIDSDDDETIYEIENKISELLSYVMNHVIDYSSAEFYN